MKKQKDKKYIGTKNNNKNKSNTINSTINKTSSKPLGNITGKKIDINNTNDIPSDKLNDTSSKSIDNEHLNKSKDNTISISNHTDVKSRDTVNDTINPYIKDTDEQYIDGISSIHSEEDENSISDIEAYMILMTSEGSNNSRIIYAEEKNSEKGVYDNIDEIPFPPDNSVNIEDVDNKLKKEGEKKKSISDRLKNTVLSIKNKFINNSKVELDECEPKKSDETRKCYLSPKRRNIEYNELKDAVGTNTNRKKKKL